MKHFHFKALSILLILSITFLFACGKTDKEEGETHILNLGEDIVMLDNETCVLDAGSEGVSYKWSTGDSTQTITVDSIGKFWVEVVFSNSEKKSDTINVDLKWRLANVKTSYGDILMWLYPQTPLHKEGFLTLVNDNYFDGNTFNRVINDFVIQGGCPDETGGFYDTSLFIDAEFHTDLKHIPGALGGGRDDNPAWRTNICQFYIVDKSAPNLSFLDMRYSIFGHVIDGLNLVDSISNVATDANDQPLVDVVISIEEVRYTKGELYSQFQFEIK